MGNQDYIVREASSYSQAERYSRQISLNEIGMAGQEKIQNAKILVIGAGGIGSAVLMYLAGAGVGKIGIVDHDAVDAANLHRQVIHEERQIGRSKTLSARDFIAALNPNVSVDIYNLKIDKENAESLVSSYSIVIDGSDNPLCRYVVSDACKKANIALISGAAVKWECQITIFCYGDSACYRCLYPECPPKSSILSCADNGVVGTAPGLAGIILATQAIKLILELPVENLLVQRLLVINLKNDNYKVHKIKNRRQGCIICDEPDKFSIKDYDYESFVGKEECKTSWNVEWEIDWEQLSEKTVFLDVRATEHYQKTPFFCTQHIPIDVLLRMKKEELFLSFPHIKKESEPLYVFCRAGVNSKIATAQLRELGICAYSVKKGYNGYRGIPAK